MSGAPYGGDTIAQFRDAIRRAGLMPPDAIEADGDLHRFPSSGKRGDDAGWYVLYGDGVPAGAFGCWRLGLSEKWRADVGSTLTDAERKQHAERIEAAKRKREQAERVMREEARQRAEREWAAAKSAADSHPYLARKGVKAHGLRVDADGRLLVPVRDKADAWQSLQFIDADGGKLFLTGGRIAGGYHSIGQPAGTICIAEGFATGATIHEATGLPVAVAFNAGNLEPVAHGLREKMPKAQLILCADDDAKTDGNPGLTKATAAARAVGGLLAVPDFGADRPDGATDFNDLAKHRGPDAVRDGIKKARTPDPEPWPEPEALISESASQPYPLDALPDLIGKAVREVADFVQCPAALPACSALSAVSVAGQGLVNVRRGPGLEGPVSLYLLTVAESGERKSECDKRFTPPLREWEAEQLEAIKPELGNYRAALATWEGQYEGIKGQIKKYRASKDPQEGRSIGELRFELEGLEAAKPAAVRVPRVLLESETAENLAYSLRTEGWPSAGLMSSEAGVIFGGHSMRRDTQMQSLALLNKLWSGESHRVGRRQSESFALVGARLTMGLAVQPGTAERFFQDTNGLARDTGFAARFLVAWPQSTQGTRQYKDPPAHWPGLTAFHSKLRRLLDTPLRFDERGVLIMHPLNMEPLAFEVWKQFHDQCESALRQGGEFADMRDVASKAAENVARVAALFHLLEYGTEGQVTATHVVCAARIVFWHLEQARRFLGGMALPKPLANAVKLDAWLLARCRAGGVDRLKARDVMNLGPNPVRLKADLMAALAQLTEASRVRLEDDGRIIRINPALLRAVQ